MIKEESIMDIMITLHKERKRQKVKRQNKRKHFCWDKKKIQFNVK